MTQTDDHTLGDTSASPAPTVFGTPTPEPKPADQPLTMDELLNEVRLVERVARICLRGDLYAEHALAAQELATLVDVDGNIVTEGDAALADQSRAEELLTTISDLETQMRAASRTVRFRAMPEDEWKVFEKANKDDAGKPKDIDDWNVKLIARCAIEPTFTEAQVKQARSKLGAPQFATLGNEAYWACTTGGLDIPKSPTFSRSLQQLGSGRS